jgi:hypothetical protein
MNTSQNIQLCEPHGDERVPTGTFGYFSARNRFHAHDLVLNEFEKSGISQATLARRMGCGTDQVNRYISAPGNWTLDTYSKLLYAISGGQPEYSMGYPLQAHQRNLTQPVWFAPFANTASSNITTNEQSVQNANSVYKKITFPKMANDV